MSDMNSQLLWQTKIVNHYTQEGQDRDKGQETGRGRDAQRGPERNREKTRKKGDRDRKSISKGSNSGPEWQAASCRPLSDPSLRVWWFANLSRGSLPGVKADGVSPPPFSSPDVISPVH